MCVIASHNALQTGVPREVAVDAIGDAHELALDDALLRFATSPEQHLVVALHQLFLGRRDGLHGELQDVVHCLADGEQHVVCRAACEIQHGYREDGQENG